MSTRPDTGWCVVRPVGDDGQIQMAKERGAIWMGSREDAVKKSASLNTRIPASDPKWRVFSMDDLAEHVGRTS